MLKCGCDQGLRGLAGPGADFVINNIGPRLPLSHLEIVERILLSFKVIVELGREGRNGCGYASGSGAAYRISPPHPANPPASRPLESENGVLPLHNEPQSRRLTAPRRQATGDVLPEEGAHGKANHHVEHRPRLLGQNTCHIDTPRRFHCGLHGSFRDFMKDGAGGRQGIELEVDRDGVSNRLAFAIIVGGEIDHVGLSSSLL